MLSTELLSGSVAVHIRLSALRSVCSEFNVLDRTLRTSVFQIFSPVGVCRDP